MTAITSIAARRLRVTLEAPAGVADAIGGVTRTYLEYARLWARLEPLRQLRAVEREEAQRTTGVASHRLTIRWRADVTTAMRFVAGTTIYAIVSTAADGHRRDLVCLVEELQP